MENRYEKLREEGHDWGAYATPPTYPLTQETGDETVAGSLCARVQERLPELAEDDCEMDSEMVAAIHGHLSVCSACAAIYAQLKRVISMVESLPPVELTKDFSAAIMQRIRNGEANASWEAARTPFAIASEAPWHDSVVHRAEAMTSSTYVPPISNAGVGAGLHDSFERPFAFERLIGAVAAAAVIVWLTLDATGPALVRGNATGVLSWLDSVSATLRGIPVLAGLFATLLSALASMADDLSGVCRDLGPAAQQGLMIYVALGVTALWWRRRRRSFGQTVGR